ncbi:MAG: DNA cytosine methyltransferase [Candidatus Margulisiibacteriota bacterium]|nr:DNA cytosine methyltransferase [Candidatus Margulisiibacteriota bacterium]
MKKQKKPLKFIDLFAGIGGIRIPFEEMGCKCVFSSDWDKASQKMYEANFGEKPFGDITKISENDIPDHDILLGGFPCQAFSIIGKGEGFADTRGTLFFEIERILKTKKPKAFLLENVKQLVGHDKGKTLRTILEHLKALGYFVHWKVLNALDFGLPQKRERIIIVGFLKNYDFNFPARATCRVDLSNILEKKVDKKYYASEKIRKKRKAKHQSKHNLSIWHENKGGNVSSYPFSCALRAGASYNYLLVNGERRLTPRECLRLMGFPDSFKIVCNYSDMRKVTGNSVCVPVIRAVAKEMLKCLREDKVNAKQNPNWLLSEQLDFFPRSKQSARNAKVFQSVG